MNYRILFAVLVASIISACSGIPTRTSDQEDLARYLQYAGEPVDSVRYLGRYDGWRALGRDNLVIFTGPSEAYLLSVAGPCNDLPFVNRVGIKSRGPTLSRGDAVIIGRGESCLITQLRPIDYRRMKQDARKSSE